MQIWSKMLLGQQKEKDVNYITQFAIARITLHSGATEFKNIKVSCATSVTSTGYLYMYLTDTSKYKPFCYGPDGALLTIAGSTGGTRYGIPFKPSSFDKGVVYTLNGGIIEISNPDYANPVQKFTIQYIISDDANPFGG